VLAQELVPPLGWDLRIVVAGERVVGAARRVAAPGEWRTNVALGARSEPVTPPALAKTLALEAAAAIRGDLVGIDLLPLGEGFVVSEVNGAVDFKLRYALGPGNIFRNAVHELVRVAQLRRAAA
jgi:glutathione synthase/RimK-type ligase-like ATP-grasp enzyme